MKYLLIALSVMSLLNSCASILNKRTEKIHIITPLQTDTIIINNTDTLCCGSGKYAVERSRKNLKLKLISNHLKDSVVIKSELDPFFVLGNIYPTYGLGWVIDIWSPKRFTYEKYNRLYFENNQLKLSQPARPLNLTFGFNGINQNSFNDTRLRSSGITYGGISLGGEIFVSPKTFFSSTMQFNFPGTVEKHYSTTEYNAFMINLLLNRRFKRFSVGTGINYSIMNTYLYSNAGRHIESKGFGPSLAMQYRFYDQFYTTLQYNGILINKYHNQLSHINVLSLGITYKIELDNLDNPKFR